LFGIGNSWRAWHKEMWQDIWWSLSQCDKEHHSHWPRCPGLSSLGLAIISDEVNLISNLW
jgi:hypothetical protein